MNITELDSYNLADAVKFHNRLNPKIWGRDEKMLPDVREKLLAAASDFQEFLGVSDLDVDDVTISGSNAAYSYTPHSDIDLHLVVKPPQDNSEVYQELFNAKKYQYNDLHDIRIHGADVELYVQPADESPVSLGEYSILHDKWIQVPRRQRAKVDQSVVRHKYEDLRARIEEAVREGNPERLNALSTKIKAMRQSGLAQHGEFGPENLAFKILRTQGYIKKLYDAKAEAKSRELSLRELAKPKQKVRYGFGESPDGVDPTTKMFLEDPLDESPDGVNPTTKMFLEDSINTESVVQEFIKHTADRLGIKRMPKILIHHDEDWSEQNHSFGMYVPERHELHVSLSNRHLLDVLRTTAHELCHCAQHEQEPLPDHAGDTGSDWENEAHAVAGIIMRDFANAHPEYFKQDAIQESASGYIPTKKQAKDPRYSMALTVDIKPGQVGKEANKLALQTDKQGKPALLMKTANLRESATGQQFLGEYPSIETALNEAQSDLVKYKKGQERQIHKDLALKHNKKDFNYDYDNEANWEDSHFVTDYTGGTSQYINDVLHKHYRNQVAKKDLQRYQRHIDSLDRILSGQKLKQPLTVYTTVPVSPADAWKRYGADPGQPIRLHLPAYTSTSTSLDVVQNIADDRLEPVKVDRQRHPPRNAQRAPLDNWGNQILMLSIPAGTPAASVQKISDYPDENEILMPRGVDIEVNPSPTVLDNGDYVWHAQVIGHNPVQIAQPKSLAESLARELELFEEQDLFEIKMTGKNLSKLAKDIQGAKVGLEFEMIVPNASVEDEGDMEPDYDQDQRVRDIDDCANFFDDGDYNSSGMIRRLRDQMYEDYWTWRSEQVDNDWYNGGDSFDYFKDYLDREDPFDEEEAEEEARNQLQSEYGDELDTEEFEKMLFALVEEKREAYVQEQWDNQGRNFDNAREEYTEERADDYSEQDWLENQGIRYASDVESSYGGDVTWPYYTSNSGDGEADIERIALEFMNDSGLPYDSVAVSSSYHGRYKKWVGNGWVDVGSNKPEDCFSIEPDGSLEGNDSDDVGLEFVSPPIPLEQVGDVMSKVQQWAASNGVYTGKSNKTSMHTNISVPGYDLDKLDYLKAALLLGDEYVLREFDRIGNSYAKPAIEKIKSLVNQKPEKAQELLDKMKSHLNAEASKLIHSGTTDKFTSINTKGNRVEFRSPGGDYLSDIADNPKKMQDMVNRMVVTLDAAMDPNKYKEEYQKKLYKVLTGQQFGREAKSGAKQEAKKDDKDLLNIFSRYAAGELPKAALKSFVRQAQLQRNVDKGKQTGKMWWRVDKEGRGSPNGTSMEVVASSKEEAIDKAASEWGFFSPQYRNRMDAYPVRPYQEPPAGSELERIERDAGVGQQGSGLYKIFDTNGRLIAGDEYGSDRAALARAGVWAMQRNVDVVVKNAQGQEIGRVSASGEITPTAQQPAQQNQGNWGIWIDGNNRFANQPGSYARGADVPLMRFPSREAAEQWIKQQRAERPNLRTDIEVREIAPRLLPGSTLDLQRQRAAAAQQPESDPTRYEMYRISDGRNVMANNMPIEFHALTPEDAERKLRIYAAAHNLGAPELFAVRNVLQPVSNINLFPEIEPAQQTGDNWSADFERRMQNPAPVEPRTEFGTGTADQQAGGIVDVAGEQPAAQTGGQFTGEWKVVDPNGREIYRFSGVGNSQSDANNVAIRWLQQNPRHLQGGVEVLPVMA
jgi:hypothetical protein